MDAVEAMVPGRPNPATVWRWARKGLRGHQGSRIKLKVWYVGRNPCTTQDAVREWLEAVTEARQAERADDTKQHDVSAEELRNAGLISARDGKGMQ